MKHMKMMTAKHLLLVKISWYLKGNRIEKKRSTETQQTLKAVAAVVWTHDTNLISNKMFWTLGWIQLLMKILKWIHDKPNQNVRHWCRG